MTSSIVRGDRVVLPHGVYPAAIHIQDGRVLRIADHGDVPAGVDVVDAGALVVMPGLVDTHVHVNEPGRTHWEGFETATRAAAAGGVTTIVDMPLNSVPATTTVAGFDAKVRAADGICQVDVGLWGGVVPGNTAELEPLANRGVLGFKAFLSPSGVEEFDHVSEADLRAALPILARLRLPLLVHAELPSALVPADPRSDRRAHKTWLASRPAQSETAAIDLLIRLATEYGAAIHIVHLASTDALPALRAARAAGVAITVETCPHYLSFCAEEIPDGRTSFKCAPPIRARSVRDGLWQALHAGDIDLVATDHSPAPPTLKHLDDGDFMAAWGGIASLQVGLAAVWTAGAPHGVTLDRIARWLSAGPASLAGLAASKGSIAPGLDADLVLWDPQAEFTVDPAALEHRHPVTPYAGMRLRGVVQRTMLRGAWVYGEGTFNGGPRGRVVRATREC